MIVILGVLSAAAVPTYRSVVDRAADASARQTVAAVAREAQHLAALTGASAVGTDALAEAARDRPESAATAGVVAARGMSVVDDRPSLEPGVVSIAADGVYGGLALRSGSGACAYGRIASSGPAETWLWDNVGGNCSGTLALAGPNASRPAYVDPLLWRAPAAPAGIVAFPGESAGSVSVEWPAVPRAQSYIVAINGTDRATVASPSAYLNGLVAGSAATVTVKAANIYGMSVPSPPVVVVLPSTTEATTLLDDLVPLPSQTRTAISADGVTVALAAVWPSDYALRVRTRTAAGFAQPVPVLSTECSIHTVNAYDHLLLSANGSRLVFSAYAACGPATGLFAFAASPDQGRWIARPLAHRIDGRVAQSSSPRISSDGRWAVFLSDDANLWPGDTNGRAGSDPALTGTDVFVTDLDVDPAPGQVSARMLSVGPGGWQTLEGISELTFSANGRYVGFRSGYARKEYTRRFSSPYPLNASEEHPWVHRSSDAVAGVPSRATLSYFVVDRDGDGDGVLDTPGTQRITPVPSSFTTYANIENRFVEKALGFGGAGQDQFVYRALSEGVQWYHYGDTTVFVWDMATGQTRNSGLSVPYGSARPPTDLSANGRYITQCGLIYPHDYAVVVHDLDADANGVMADTGAAARATSPRRDSNCMAGHAVSDSGNETMDAGTVPTGIVPTGAARVRHTQLPPAHPVPRAAPAMAAPAAGPWWSTADPSGLVTRASSDRMAADRAAAGYAAVGRVYSEAGNHAMRQAAANTANPPAAAGWVAAAAASYATEFGARTKQAEHLDRVATIECASRRTAPACAAARLAVDNANSGRYTILLSATTAALPGTGKFDYAGSLIGCVAELRLEELLDGSSTAGLVSELRSQGAGAEAEMLATTLHSSRRAAQIEAGICLASGGATSLKDLPMFVGWADELFGTGAALADFGEKAMAELRYDIPSPALFTVAPSSGRAALAWEGYGLDDDRLTIEVATSPYEDMGSTISSKIVPVHESATTVGSSGAAAWAGIRVLADSRPLTGWTKIAYMGQ